jgi:hypothetical protein
MKKFYILAVTKSDNDLIPEEGGFTSLLKCPECNSYYLVDLHDSEYPNQNTVLIKNYNSKIDEEGLIKIVKRLEGIITDVELDEYSKLRSFITNTISKDGKDDIDINENKN